MVSKQVGGLSSKVLNLKGVEETKPFTGGAQYSTGMGAMFFTLMFLKGICFLNHFVLKLSPSLLHSVA